MFEFMLKPLKKRFGADKEYYKILDSIFGLYPNNIELYKLALIHRSASVFLDDGSPINNERLEFLGDAILESIVSDYLFIEFPQRNEGFLTQMRSKIVSRSTLNDLCVSIGLDKYIVSHSGGTHIQKHLFGDALEAMIGAMYLDKGYDYTNRLIINKILCQNIDLEQMTLTETDFKSRLIEWCQKSKHTVNFATSYSPESTSHHPIFRSQITIDGLDVAYGNGTSKKEAEQHAACSLWQILSDEAGDNLLEMMDHRSAEARKNTTA